MAELHLYGVIDEDSQASIRRALNEIPKDEAIQLYIASPGGYLGSGIAIYNWLKQRKSVDVTIEGDALSAASLVAMAGDNINMVHNGLLMIHDPWFPVLSPATIPELSKSLKYLEVTKRQAVKTYHDKTRIAEGMIATLMEQETYMTAEDALSRGFIDNVVPNENSVRNLARDEYTFVKHPDKLALAMEKRPSPILSASARRERSAKLFTRITGKELCHQMTD